MPQAAEDDPDDPDDADDAQAPSVGDCSAGRRTSASAGALLPGFAFIIRRSFHASIARASSFQPFLPRRLPFLLYYKYI